MRDNDYKCFDDFCSKFSDAGFRLWQFLCDLVKQNNERVCDFYEDFPRQWTYKLWHFNVERCKMQIQFYVFSVIFRKQTPVTLHKTKCLSRHSSIWLMFVLITSVIDSWVRLHWVFRSSWCKSSYIYGILKWKIIILSGHNFAPVMTAVMTCANLWPDVMFKIIKKKNCFYKISILIS